jgi:hypothetical protein
MAAARRGKKLSADHRAKLSAAARARDPLTRRRKKVKNHETNNEENSSGGS